MMKKQIIRGLALMLALCLLTFSAAAVSSGGIQILDADGSDITGQTLTMQAGDQETVYYSLDAVMEEIIRSADGGAYNIKATMSWTTSNLSVIGIAETDGSYGYSYGYATALTAKAAGTATITADAQVSYSTGDGETATLTQSAFFLVTVEGTDLSTAENTDDSYPRNPFKDIDLAQVENPFSDVSNDVWFYDCVMYLYAAGMFDGVNFGSGAIYAPAAFSTTDTEPTYHLSLLTNTSVQPQISMLSSGSKTLNPSAKENRGFTVSYLYNGHKSIGGTVGSYTQNIFTDVSSTASYYQPVLWASANGVVDGYGDGKFGPSDGITREQFCTILLRYANYAGITLPTDKAAAAFSDSQKISSWAKDAVTACQKAGIINGYTDGTFRPKDGISRAEVSKMIYEFYNLIP